MSCYFRYIKDVFDEAGVTVTPQTKKALDQAIHRLMNVPYKSCMPDCWGTVKKTVADPSQRRRFVAQVTRLRRAATAEAAPGVSPRPRRGGGGG